MPDSPHGSTNMRQFFWKSFKDSAASIPPRTSTRHSFVSPVRRFPQPLIFLHLDSKITRPVCLLLCLQTGQWALTLGEQRAPRIHKYRHLSIACRPPIIWQQLSFIKYMSCTGVELTLYRLKALHPTEKSWSHPVPPEAIFGKCQLCRSKTLNSTRLSLTCTYKKKTVLDIQFLNVDVFALKAGSQYLYLFGYRQVLFQIYLPGKHNRTAFGLPWCILWLQREFVELAGSNLLTASN